MKVVLYTKPDDERCARALKALEDAKGKLAFELSTCDATGDSRYEARVPVVVADGREIASGEGSPEALERSLKSAAERGGVSRRGKIVFVVAAAASLVGILGFKAWQVFVEPSQAEARYLGIEPVEGLAPEFVLQARDGKQVKLSDFRGKVVFLNFWATWCPTCKTEMPSMTAMLHTLRDPNLVAIAATVDESWEPVDTYLGKQPLPYQVLRDPEQKWAGSYGTSKFPETYVIGPDGRLRAKFVGSRDWSDRAFELYFRKLLSEVGSGQTASK
ncbi:MAG TPA: redoxin domain-containing protein [Myxococcales bacterium]|jgi:peroxiredoxin